MIKEIIINMVREINEINKFSYNDNFKILIQFFKNLRVLINFN